METLETWSIDVSAADVINQAVASGDSGSEIMSNLEQKKEALEAAERAKVEAYINAMRPIYAGMLIGDFDGNTAGLYNGLDIYVDQSVLMVGTSVDQTIAQATEVYDHECYHMENHHTEPLMVMAETRGEIVAVIGEVELTETALVEGLTVMQTGHEFVSREYVTYKQQLGVAMSNAELNIDQVEEAVNTKKDITLIDDRAREKADAASYSSSI